MIATFCGHSQVDDSIAVVAALQKVIAALVEEGITEFYLGGYGSFDYLAATVVRDQKSSHPEIQSILIIPYIDRDYDKRLYDDSLFPPLESVPRRFAISKRNEWMIEQSDVVISYITHGWGGAAKTLEYAKRKKKRIISVI